MSIKTAAGVAAGGELRGASVGGGAKRPRGAADANRLSGKNPKTRLLNEFSGDEHADPLGWRREIVLSRSGTGREDVYFHSPCGEKLRSRPDIQRFLDRKKQEGISQYLAISPRSFNFKCSKGAKVAAATAAAAAITTTTTATCVGNNDYGGLHPTLPIRTRVLKKFDGVGYFGEVIRYDEKQQWYKVRYSDGEKEDMDLHELFEAGVAAGVADTVANARQSDPTLQTVTKERDDLFRKLGVVTEDRNALRAESDRLRAEIDRQDRALACSVCFDRRPNQRWPGGCGHIFCKECLLAQQEVCRKSRTVMKCPLCKCCVISGANNIFMDAVATDKA
jgi:hypothetical protein